VNADCELCAGWGWFDLPDPVEPRDPERARAMRCPACAPADVPVEALVIGPDHG